LWFLAVATLGGALAPIVAYLWPPKKGATLAQERIAVAPTSDLPLNKGAVYSVNGKAVIVIHAEDGYKALSAVCTHLACIVYWNPDRRVIQCPCHAGFYRTDGTVISGPPPAPLKVHRVQAEGNQIYVEA